MSNHRVDNMEFKDYYKVLGVEKDADQDSIKSRFRELARKYHPDVNSEDGEAEAKFKEVTEAYEVLGDMEKRRQYDEVAAYRNAGKGDFDWNAHFAGAGSQGNGNGRFRGGFQGGFDDAGADSFSDFFHFIFGREHEFVHPARDLRAELPVTLEQLHRGDEVVVDVGGEKLKVAIPPGLRDGSVLRLTGRGAAGPDGSRGDLLLMIREERHPIFRRKGNDLHREATTDLYTAVLGGSIHLDTLDGRVELRIPPESEPGTSLRLKNRGLSSDSSGSDRGDLLVKLNVEFPRNLTQEEKDLFRRLSELRQRPS